MKTNSISNSSADALKISISTVSFNLLNSFYRIISRKRVLAFLIVFCVTATFNAANAQISGYVFRDFNLNGVKDNSAAFNEPFVTGISVKATLPSGTVFTTSTNSLGAYSFTAIQIPATTKVRIEFYDVAAGDYSSINGGNIGSNVQFTSAPDAAVNYAVNAPEDYWNTVSMPNPPLMVVNSRRGTTNSYYKDQYTVLEIDNNTSGPANPADENVVTADTTKRAAFHHQTGSVFGLAVQSKQERFFTSAILKRASGFGPQGSGGIYIVGRSGASWNMAGSFSLQGVTPANGGPALDFGTVTRVTSPATDDNFISDGQTYTLPGPGGSDARDIDAFAKAGTMSFGDIEADPLSDKIYMVNLFQKRLIVFDAASTTSALNGASAATLSAFTNAYDITSLPGCPAPTGAGNNIRPYAVKIYKGKGYLGVVSDAMATQLRSHLLGYILQFDPQNIGAGFTTVVTISFNSYKDIWNGRYWRPWVNTWVQTGGTVTTGPYQYAQPMISGIEFNEDGSMDIAIRDRWGDQGATYEYLPVSGSMANVQTVVMGDLLHACYTGTGWALEGTPGSCDQPVTNINVYDATNNFGGGFSYGNTGREWYADRSGDGDFESGEGGVTKLMGSGNIVSTVYDPMEAGETVGTNYWSTQGLQWNTITTGAKHHVARIQGTNSGSMDKANGMGDVEFLRQFQPIQIGNRIWLDVNGDGIQDADEDLPGVPAGTTVTLRSPGIDGLYNTADDQTWTTTTNATGNYYFSTLSVADNRKPASWTAVGNTVLVGYNYRIEVAIPSGKIVTLSNMGGASGDNIDNDAAILGANAVIEINTAYVNHNYDIGLMTFSILPAESITLTGTRKNNTASLIWITSTEHNTSYFELERSINGKDFLSTGQHLAASGNSLTEKQYYSYDDLAAVQPNGNVYYRVKLYDHNGNYRYSNIAIIKFDDITFKIWPNPIVEKLFVSIPSSSKGTVLVNISDATGRIIKQQQQAVVPGINQFVIPQLSGITPGLYIIDVFNNSDNKRASRKFLKE
jgi:SdrD B-like domain